MGTNGVRESAHPICLRCTLGASLGLAVWGTSLPIIAWFATALIDGASVVTTFNLKRAGQVTNDEALSNESRD
jgi:hypothetical protein